MCSLVIAAVRSIDSTLTRKQPIRQHYCELSTQHREAGRRRVRPGQVTYISKTCFSPQSLASRPIFIELSGCSKSSTPSSSSSRCDLRYPLPPSPDSKEAMADHHPNQTGGHHQHSHHSHGTYQWPSDTVALEYLECWAELQYRIQSYHAGHPAANRKLENILQVLTQHGLDETSSPAELARTAKAFLSTEKAGKDASHILLPDLHYSAMSHLKLPANILVPGGGVLNHETHKNRMGRLINEYHGRKDGLI